MYVLHDGIIRKPFVLLVKPLEIPAACNHDVHLVLSIVVLNPVMDANELSVL